jgi:crotonobetainyl-CoA:carnitine CoA-transferase CaiB-like acyl-CoA transferase
VLAGLRVRDRDGIGQHVSVNLLSGQIATLANFITPYFQTHEPIRRAGGGHPQIVPYQVFGTPGGPIVVACLNDTFWAPICRGIGREELIDDPRFVNNPARAANRDELVPLLEELLASAPRDHWLERLRAQGAPCAPVNELHEALAEPQIAHNGALIELTHPRYGSYTVPNNPINMSASPPRPKGYVPGVGEHTRQVLAEFDYDEATISKFETMGVL